MGKKFDCSGWATKANLLCADGRVIMKNAFKECDGETVPVVWNHQHNSVDKVLGHALLENRDDGVYAYVSFNDTDSGQNAKLLVQHGDVSKFSIYANRLKQHGSNVVHGVIRELSLVLAGANPGAVIDSVIMHGEDSYEEGYIYLDDNTENIEVLCHADSIEEGEEKVAEETNKSEINVLDGFTEEQQELVHAMITAAVEKAKNNSSTDADSAKNADDEKADNDETIGDVFEKFTEKQKKVVYAMIAMAVKEAKAGNFDEEDENEDEEGGNSKMKHNLFDKETENTEQEILTHSEMTNIFKDAKRCGSLKEAVLQHGIENIDYLFPDAQTLDKEPGFIKRPDDWVADVMGGVHKIPFSRIKSVFANITEADARARGYIKGNQKVDEVFSLLKRTTSPTTVYKKQTLDRDDVVDITEFDIVVWLKKEMRMMLEEELARAILVGDGRNSSSNDKINEQNIRPIWTDDNVYTVNFVVNVAPTATSDDRANAFIRSCIKSRKEYKGSGDPTMFMSEDMLTDCLLLTDKNGRVIYDTIEKLATTLRVKKIVSVPIMEGLSREVGSKIRELAGIYVNLNDYNLGADKGGAVSMFDDFDIDFNAMKYLIETRCSGALNKPYSAVALEFEKTA